jgi:hypothetical protein
VSAEVKEEAEYEEEKRFEWADVWEECKYGNDERRFEIVKNGSITSDEEIVN